MRFLRHTVGAEITEVLVAVGLIIAGGSAVIALLMGGLNTLATNVNTFITGLSFTNPGP